MIRFLSKDQSNLLTVMKMTKLPTVTSSEVTVLEFQGRVTSEESGEPSWREGSVWGAEGRGSWALAGACQTTRREVCVPLTWEDRKPLVYFLFSCEDYDYKVLQRRVVYAS